MAINFLAESMQGYNNPQIEIVNVELAKNGTVTTPITFDDIAKILARGVFPIVSLWSAVQGEKMRYILPLSFARDNEILFSTIIMDGSPNDLSCSGVGFKFVPSRQPFLVRMLLQGIKP